MPRDPAPAPRPRRIRRTLASALAATTVTAGAACASESDITGADIEVVSPGEFEATAGYLRTAAERSAVEGYRIELRFSTSDEMDDDATPLMAGTIDGDRYHVTVDLRSVFEQLADPAGERGASEMAGLDLSVEMAGDRETLYMRAPIYGLLGQVTEDSGRDMRLGPFADLAAMGDGWGVVGLDRLGETVPADVASAMGAGGIDPGKVVDLVRRTEDVEDLGIDEIRGDRVHGLSAELSMGDLLEASGQDPAAFAETNLGDAGEELAASMYATTTPMDIWIDDDGYLRRIEYALDMDELASTMDDDAADLVGETRLAGLDLRYAMDMFDYGATVEFEPPDDAVDITDAFAEILNL